MTRTDLVHEAYSILKKSTKPIDFKTLFKKVCKKLKIKEQDEIKFIGNFYSDLVMDARLVLINDKWDLRSRNSIDNCVSKILDEDFDIEEDEDEDREIDDGEEDNIDY